MKSQTENQIQADFFSWLALHEKKYPELGLFYAIPNGSWKSPAARGLFKRTGLKAGVPDVHLPVPVTNRGLNHFGRWHGLWIEFKSGRGKLSSNQIAWIEKLQRAGHCVIVCQSWTDAVNQTIEYLKLPLMKFNEQQNGRPGGTGGTKQKRNY